MKLYELEEQLTRMREQGADDYTKVVIGENDTDSRYNANYVKSVSISCIEVAHGKRIIKIS